jgi:Flp pilus assembly protein CpaB
MSRQSRAIAIAVALAAITVVVISHRRHPDRIDTGTAVQVLVANKAIQKGTSGDVIRSDPALYSVVAVQPSQAASGAIVDPATLVGKVAVADIARGQQITAADFDPSKAISTPPPGPRAVVVTPTKAIGGPIAAGSHVDVLVATNKSGKLRELYRNLQVLSVSDDGRTVTLRATPQQAGKLIYAMQHGHLVLRR